MSSTDASGSRGRGSGVRALCVATWESGLGLPDVDDRAFDAVTSHGGCSSLSGVTDS